jgi:hypothetical protein
MNEPLTIGTERGDDLLLLIAHMQRMGLVSLLDAQFSMYGNREGVSLG